jgi:hypothetical protein
VLTSFSCPNANCGGIPVKIKAGTKINPAPPVTASKNPATKEANINIIIPMSK